MVRRGLVEGAGPREVRNVEGWGLHGRSGLRGERKGEWKGLERRPKQRGGAYKGEERGLEEPTGERKGEGGCLEW